MAGTASSLGWFTRTVGSLLRERNLLVKESVAQDSFLWLSTFSCIFLVVHQSHKNWESNCHNLQTVIRVQGLHTMGRCPVSWRDSLWHCCHHLSAMQPSAWCLTPWLRWTRALFAIIVHYIPLRRGCLGLHFGLIWKDVDVLHTV
jgi:hypothetical protein